jgi:hypothetical protein
MHADITSLRVAHRLGMRYTLTTMTGAVRCNRAAVVQFLRTEVLVWDATIFNIAAERGDIELCAYKHRDWCP